MIFAINRGKLVQIFVAILSCFVGLFMGLYVGWTSPMVTIFSSKDETPLPSGPMTQTEISLMSSLLYIGAIIGAFLSGWLANRIGRKWGIFISMVPQIFANVLIIVAEEPILLLIARTVNGFVVGVANVVLPIFLSEISEDSLKTTIGLFSGIIFNIGIFLGKFLTGFFGIYAVPIFTFPLTVIFIGAFFICPDTPEYLLLRNRLQDAEKSLKFYRGVPKLQPMPETCAMEFEEMKAVVNIKGRGSRVTIEDFKEGATILAVIISAVLTSTMNFTGVRITTSFTEVLLIDSGIPMDTSMVDMAISSMQLIGTLTSIYITRKIGVRKSILIYYTLGALALIGASIHYYLHDLGLDLYPAMWSFLTFLAISVVIPSTGLNNLSYSIPPMILPHKIRGPILGSFIVFHFILACFMMQYYLSLVNNIGNTMIVGIFGLWCFFGVIFSYFFIPDVNRMTYTEIVELLNNKIPRKLRNFS